jgi:DNA adenine methylase
MAQQQKQIYPSPLRYPGGKGMLANFMKLVISQNNLADGQYVEVYGGGAAIAWSLLSEDYVQKVHVNDLDRAIIAFWKSVLDDTEALCRLISDTPVNMEQWLRQRAILTNPDDHSQLELGFSTFFLNRTNRSGILRGGVIGGKHQTGKWKIDARYNKKGLIQRIQRIAGYSNQIVIHNLDAAQFIQTVLPILPKRTLVYLDPPYFNKGQRLYKNHYSKADHQVIAGLVSIIKQPWLVSYDSCTEIDTLYAAYSKIPYCISYSAQDRYSGSEVMFFSATLTAPSIDDPTSVKLTNHMKPLL